MAGEAVGPTTIARPASASADAVAATPWLSLLVFGGNATGPLAGCLASTTAQAAADVEVLVSAGAFPDRGASHNALLDAARGKYVWLLDANDRLTASAISELRALVDRDNPDLVLCDSLVLTPWISPQYRRRSALRPITFSGPHSITLANRSALICRLLSSEHLQARSIISRRRLWSEALRFPEHHRHGEAATILRLALRAHTYHYAPASWITHRMEELATVIDAQDCEDLSAALFDFSREFRLFRQASEEARFMVSHACARNFIRAATQAAQSAEPESQLARYRRNFKRATVLGPGELLRRYLEHGWRAHWMLLSYWLNKSCAAAKRQAPETGCPPLKGHEPEARRLPPASS